MIRWDDETTGVTLREFVVTFLASAGMALFIWVAAIVALSL